MSTQHSSTDEGPPRTKNSNSVAAVAESPLIGDLDGKIEVTPRVVDAVARSLYREEAELEFMSLACMLLRMIENPRRLVVDIRHWCIR